MALRPTDDAPGLGLDGAAAFNRPRSTSLAVAARSALALRHEPVWPEAGSPPWIDSDLSGAPTLILFSVGSMSVDERSGSRPGRNYQVYQVCTACLPFLAVQRGLTAPVLDGLLDPHAPVRSGSPSKCCSSTWNPSLASRAM